MTDAFRIALLSSFTARGVGEALERACRDAGIAAAVTLGGYNQYAQEILDPGSALYKADPNLVILYWDTRAILGEQFFLPYRMSDEARRTWVDEKSKELLSLIDAVKQHSSAAILVHNFEVPLYSPLGILESKQSFGFHEAVETLNAKLRDAFKANPHVFLFDYDAFCAKIGKRQTFDHKMYYLGDIKLHARYLPELARAYLGYIKPMLGRAKKCIVLDLDNTLWGGVVGEDGLEGIKLGPTAEGRPFWEFQKHLLSLFERGVILAVNSKNNPEDVARVFAEHPHMVLKPEHFAAIRVNWEDKVANMRSLADEINIGLDSLVFFDDDKANRAFVRAALPEVEVVDLPEDPALYVSTLTELDAFHTVQATDEDRERGKMYAVDRQRKAFASTTTDLREYLRALAMVVTIEPATTQSIPRIAQLTQKTNQFNMTTRRYTDADIARMANSSAFRAVSLRVEDRFGDNGIVGVAIVERMSEHRRVDTFLLSCRIIGRGVEDALLAYLIAEAREAEVPTLVGEFVSTKKNAPAKWFYKKNGFTLRRTVDGVERWEYDCMRPFPFPDTLTVRINEDPISSSV